LPNPAKLAAYVNIFVRVFWEYMTSTHKKRGNMTGSLQEWQLKQLVALPLVRRINQQVARSLKLSRNILKRLKEVEDSIEIIARQMARQLKQSK
jgi:hypothetical protein